MGTDNKSPSYLSEREFVRDWLSNTEEGRHTVDLLKQEDGQSIVSQVLDDDQWVDWAEMLDEHREDLALASNCAEARKSVDLARKSNSLNAPPMPNAAKWLKFFSPPMWYVLRKQVELMDPDYWNDPKNTLREALKHPEWTTVSAEYIRGQLEQYLGKSAKLAS
jgi:hypothetical protein